MWLIIFSRNTYPRISAPSGMIRRTTIVLMSSDARAELDYGPGSPALLSERCRAVGRNLSCAVAGDLPDLPLLSVRLPDAVVGANGELATVWGSVSDLVTLNR